VPVSFQFKTALKLHDQAATDLSIRLPIALNVQGSLPLELGKYRWRILLKEFEADAGYAAFEVLSKVTPTVSGSGPVLQHPDL